MSKLAKVLPPLADVVLELEADMRPNGQVVASSPVVLVRAKGWTEKKKPPKWTMALAAELALSFVDADQENLTVFLLSADRVLLGIYCHSKGTSTETALDAYHVLKMALLTKASEVVLLHNHPSGDSTPSDNDHISTRYTAGVLKSWGIVLREHIVVGDGEATVLDWEGGRFVEKRGMTQEFQHRPQLVAMLAPSSLAPRGMARPFGKYDVWLVQAGLVRTEMLSALREKSKRGTIDHEEDAMAYAMEAAHLLRFQGVDPTDLVVTLVINRTRRATSVSWTAGRDVFDQEGGQQALLRAAFLETLLSGGAAFLLLRLNPKSGTPFTWRQEGIDLRWLWSRQEGTLYVELVDYLVGDTTTGKILYHGPPHD